MGIVENVKELALTIQKIDNIDLYRRILDLQGEVQGLVEENRRLRDKVDELEKLWSVSQELSFEHNSYWRVQAGGVREGPFCSNCWDSRKVLLRMHRKSDNYASCPTCKDSVNVTGQASQTDVLRTPSAFSRR